MTGMSEGHDERLIELVKLADASAGECEWEHQIVEAVVGGHRDDPDRQRLADAFRFHARDDGDGDRFGPMLTFEGGATVPAPLSEIPDETCAVWAAVVGFATSPRVRARLHDLLFERRWGDVGSHGAGAIQAYIEDAALIDLPSLRAADGLRRAYDLSRCIRREIL